MEILMSSGKAKQIRVLVVWFYFIRIPESADKCRVRENMKGFPQGGERGKGSIAEVEEQPLANDGYAPCVGVRMV